MSQDRIYSVPLNQIGDFTFDDAVADVFPDMIRRSVPGYASMLSMIAQCAKLYARPTTNIYDLGCSLGAATRLICEGAPAGSTVIAVDSSEAMTTRLQQSMTNRPEEGPALQIQQADIREITIERSSLAVLNLTLQFLPPAERDTFIRKIADGTLSGGALIVSEKICFDDEAQQELMTTMHHDFKRAHGYSDLEIAQKRTAIENRLIPETLEAHVQRLRDAGFTTVAPWFQCFNFASILAVK